MHFLLFLVTMRRSTWFPLSSLVILLIAGIICFVGHCESGKKNLTFVSGILFVLAGKAKYVLYKICINECQAGKVKYSLPKKCICECLAGKVKYVLYQNIIVKVKYRLKQKNVSVSVSLLMACALSDIYKCVPVFHMLD